MVDHVMMMMMRQCLESIGNICQFTVATQLTGSTNGVLSITRLFSYIFTYSLRSRDFSEMIL